MIYKFSSGIINAIFHEHYLHTFNIFIQNSLISLNQLNVVIVYYFLAAKCQLPTKAWIVFVKTHRNVPVETWKPNWMKFILTCGIYFSKDILNQNPHFQNQNFFCLPLFHTQKKNWEYLWESYIFVEIFSNKSKFQTIN